jgi:hypothetical protein
VLHTIGESIVPSSQRKPWQQRAIDAFLVVSFFLIGFFSASRDTTADQDKAERHKSDTPITQEAS